MTSPTLTRSRDEILAQLGWMIQELAHMHTLDLGLKQATLDFGSWSVVVTENGTVQLSDAVAPEIVSAILFPPGT